MNFQFRTEDALYKLAFAIADQFLATLQSKWQVKLSRVPRMQTHL